MTLTPPVSTATPLSIFVENTWPTVVAWTEKEIFTLDSAYQIVVMGVAYIFAFLISKPLKKYLEKKIQKVRESGGKATLLRAVAKYILKISWAAILAVLILVNDQLGEDRDWIRVMVSLLVAWVIVGICSKIWAKSLFTKTIAFIVWVSATLDILGLLDEARFLSSEIEIPLGKSDVSLLNLFRFLFLALVLVWGALGISSLLQRRIEKSHSLAPSAKVLITKALHFSLLFLAILFSLDAVNIDISSLAFFGGALGVGIGFGLQKVVSNLICGIILLMDRSIKPGDILEINGRQGIVNTLGARFTSLLTRDGKEVLIPNETIITQEVVNWSYSNEYIRSDIPIGVSYSSDIDLVTKIIMEITNETPRVLKTPEPLCFLTAFGESSVNFELRLWIGDPQNGVANVTDQILRSLWKKFKEHNIQIPFPQRDLHIKTPGAIQTLAK